MKDMDISTTLSCGSQSRRIMHGTIVIVDPSEIITKGCEERLKPSKKNSTSKARQCRGSGRRGVLHDKCNCPNLQDEYVLITMCSSVFC